MQSKQKKSIIIASVVLAVIVAVIVSCVLLTRLRTVNVEFRERLAQNETMIEEGALDKVKQSGDFKYGKNVLFMKFDKNIAKIEKENPYVKVEQITRYFPGKVVVYISERIPKYRIQNRQNANEWFILDKDFKVLDLVSTGNLNISKCGSETFYDKTVEIDPDSLTLTSNIGDFVSDDTHKQKLENIMSGVYAYASDYFGVKSIKIEKDTDFVFTLTMKNPAVEGESGCKIKIVGSEDLVSTARYGIATYFSELNSSTYSDISACEIVVEKIDGTIKVVSTKGFTRNEA